MTRILRLTFIAVALSLGACASAPIDLKSVRIAYEPVSDDVHLDVKPSPAVILRIDYTTTFDFEAHGEPIAYLIPCGVARNHLGRPIGDDYGMDYITPRFSAASKIPWQVFTARFGPGGYEHLFSIAPSDEAPQNGVWSVRFTDLVNSQGLCFFVMSAGNLFDSPSSATFRIDGMME